MLSWGHPLPGSGLRQLISDFSLSCPPDQFLVVIWQIGGQRQTLSLVMLHEGRLIGDWTAAERDHLDPPALRAMYAAARFTMQSSSATDGSSAS